MNEFAPSTATFARERLVEQCGLMRSLVGGLLDESGKVAEEIHAIRKLGKSLRGGFALFGLEKSSALEIQAVGRLLSEPRDAVSRFKTWYKLEWNQDPKVALAIEKLLEQQTHSAAHRPPAETIHWCLERIDAATASLTDMEPSDPGESIRLGLQKLEKRVIKRCKKLDHRDEEDFHEARKAIKAWLGAIAFLPVDQANADPVFYEMGELLGDENDLNTLGTWLQSHGFTKKFAPDLWNFMNSSRRALQKKVIKDSRNL